MRRAIGLIILLGLAPLAEGAVGDLKAVSVAPWLALQQPRFYANTKDFAKAGGGNGLTSKHATVATLRVGGGGAVIKVALDSRSPTGDVPDLIRLDLSGKGNFKGCPTLPLKLRGEGTSVVARIGPATIQAQRDGKAVPLQVRGYYYVRGSYRYLYMQFGTALEGSCAFGAKTFRVRIIDGDGNFRCGDPAKMKVKDGKAGEIAMGDTLQVFGGDRGASVQRLFFGQRVKVDGKWYEVKISPDGSKVSAAEAKVEMGQVRIRREQWSATLVGTKHFVMLSGGAAPVKVPAGEYVFMAYTEMHKDGARLRCFGGRAPQGALKVFTVSAGKVTDLAAGSPMTAGLDVMSGGGQTIFSLMLFDASGATVANLAIANGQRPDAPRIEVHDAAGKKIYDGKMKYG